MSQERSVPVKGSYNHIEWIDLQGTNILTEVAVMKRDQLGNTHFFPVGSLDAIDKARLRNILTGRNAAQYPLWDLMQSVTLGNGINALTYFHQLVQILTPGGQVIDVSAGKMGVPIASGVIDAN